jgi:galactokinase
MSRDLAAILADRLGPREQPIVVARAPGRVNLIGEHTDYNQGFVLPTILDRHVEVAARRGEAAEVRLLALDRDESLAYGPGTEPDAGWPDWAPYLVGLIEEMRARDLLDGGLDLAVRGTLPAGAGLASSAALEIAAALALERVAGIGLDPLGMAHLCRDVEHHWAGVRCGIMDQLASRLGRPGHALLVDCRDGTHRHLPLPLSEHALVICDSGRRRQLGDSAYNQRRQECEQAVALLQRHAPEIGSLRELTPELLDRHAAALPPELCDRCRHVVDENARVLASEVALAAGDLGAFGRLMNLSHASLRDLFQASDPLLDRLVTAAAAVPGVLGSRLTGAGWGGCTVTLCRRDAVAVLRERLELELHAAGSPGSVFLVSRPRAAGVITERD